MGRFTRRALVVAILAAILTLGSDDARAQSTPVTTESAAGARVERLLTALGVPGPLRRLRVQGDGSLRPDGTVRHWEVSVLSGGNGELYEASLTADGGRTEIHRYGADHGLFLEWTPKPADARQQERARALLAAVGTREPTRTEYVSRTHRGDVAAFFPILRHGHPFIAGTRYGYRFVFDAGTGEFLRFAAVEAPPPVAAAPPGKPKVDRAAALAVLKRVFDAELRPAAMSDAAVVGVSYAVRGEPSLGFFHREGMDAPLLVWEIRYTLLRATRRGVSGGGGTPLVVDATTGLPVPPTVPRK